MENLISDRQVRALLALADERHFARAAERLGLAAPQLSELMRRLEDSVGFRLFVRRPAVRPTPAGEVMIETARQLVRDHADGLRRARAAAAGETGRVRLGLIPAALGPETADLLHRYRRDHPDCALTLIESHSADLLRRLEDGAIDLAITRRLAWPSGVAAVEMIKDRVVVVARADHPVARAATVRLSDLQGEPFIFFSRTAAPAYYDQIVAACARAGLTFGAVQEINSTGSGQAMVLAGFGVTLLTEASARDLADGLVARPILDPMPSASLWLSHRPGHAPAAARRLEAVLATGFRTVGQPVPPEGARGSADG